MVLSHCSTLGRGHLPYCGTGA